MTDHIDDSIVYVDFDPIDLNLVAHFDHIHVRSSERCLKRRAGELCENDLGKLRAQVAEIEGRLTHAAQWLIDQSGTTRNLETKSALLAVSRMLDAAACPGRLP